MAKATETNTETVEAPVEVKTRGLSIVIPQELYEKVEEASWELRERSLSGTVRAILKKHFAGK